MFRSALIRFYQNCIVALMLFTLKNAGMRYLTHWETGGVDRNDKNARRIVLLCGKPQPRHSMTSFSWSEVVNTRGFALCILSEDE